MGKVSKAQAEANDKAMQLINSDKPLKEHEKEFILQNYDESFNHTHKNIGAFFTPFDLAKEFRWFTETYEGGRIIDLCSGIGALSYHAWHHNNYGRTSNFTELVCVEFVEEYVEIGKRIVPDATWIIGSILDMNLMLSLGEFNVAISNPPFGNIKTGESEENWYGYTGNEFDYKAIAVAKMIAESGAFILPQGSCPIIHTNGRIERQNLRKYETFKKETEIHLEMNSFSLNPKIYEGFKHTNVSVEIMECEF